MRHTVPVKSLAHIGTTSSGSTRNSAGCRYCAFLAGTYGYFISRRLVFFFLQSSLYSPAQPVRGYTLSYIISKPWSQVASLPPRYMPSFLSRIGFQHSLFSFLCSSILIECCHDSRLFFTQEVPTRTRIIRARTTHVYFLRKKSLHGHV